MAKRYDVDFWPDAGKPGGYRARVPELDVEVQSDDLDSLDQKVIDAIVAHSGRPSGLSLHPVRPPR